MRRGEGGRRHRSRHNRAELDGHPLPGNPPEAIVGKRVLQTIQLVVVPPSIEAGDGGRMSGMIITR